MAVNCRTMNTTKGAGFSLTRKGNGEYEFTMVQHSTAERPESAAVSVTIDMLDAQALRAILRMPIDEA